MKSEQKGQESSCKEIYLDANFFIYAAVDLAQAGNNARKIIGDIRSGKYKAYTSTVTFDEVLWIIQKNNTKEEAASAVENYLQLVNLEIVAVDRKVLQRALEIYKKEGLKPRDAIHVAVMREKRIQEIFTEDADFSALVGIQRIDFTK